MTTGKGKAYWAKHVEAWRGSGLTQERYCARYGLSVTSLKYWSWHLRRLAQTSKTAALTLVPVRASGMDAGKASQTPPSGCVVRGRDGWEVEFTVSPQADYLADLLKGLS